MAAGVIYILLNPAHIELLKIGKTTRTAEERAAELSNGTGVPGRFVVAYEDKVADCDRAERIVFKALERHRYGKNKEFFLLKLKEALPIVMDVVSRVNSDAKREAKEKAHEVPVQDSVRQAVRFHAYLSASAGTTTPKERIED